MARPKLNAEEKKTDRVTIRFRKQELKELLEQADISGLNVAELIRRRSLNKRITAAIDLKMLAELRRLGGLLKHFFNETGGLHSNKTANILDELHAAAIRVGRMEGERSDRKDYSA